MLLSKDYLHSKNNCLKVNLSENVLKRTISDYEKICPVYNGSLHEFLLKGMDEVSNTLKGYSLAYFPQFSGVMDHK